MKILAIDTSTSSGSIALLEDDRLIAESTTCVKKTHAEMLLPSIKSVMEMAGADVEDIDLFALTTGPGSFTGLRIGLSTIKGIAWGVNRPVAGVSTLEALAMNMPYSDKQVCPILDARKKELYAGLYRCSGGYPSCIMADAAISPDALIERIQEPTIFIGDGIKVYGELIKGALKDRAILAPPHLWPIRGSNVGIMGLNKFKNGDVSMPETIGLKYLRLSEAELKQREHKIKFT